MTVAVRRPVDDHDLRHPHRTVDGIDGPVTVAIEFLVADHIARHVAGGSRFVLTVIAVFSPQIQTVGGSSRGQRELRLIAAIHLDGFVTVYVAAARNTMHCGTPAPHRELCARVLIVHVEAIAAGLQQFDVAVRSFDLEAIVVERADTHVDRSGRDAQAHAAIIDVHDLQRRARTKPHYGRANMHFGARARLDPDLVATRQRTIGQVIDPRVGAGWFQRAAPVQQVDARHATGRIFIGGKRCGRSQCAAQRRDGDQPVAST